MLGTGHNVKTYNIKTYNGYTNMLKEIIQTRIPQFVVNQIQELILQGKVKAGERLPTEEQLSKIFNASRGSLREALRVLEQNGLIVVKPGAKGGVFVKALTTDQVSQSLGMLLRYQRVSLKDLIEFREGVEGVVAELAAKRAKTKDIRYLKGLLRKAETCFKEGGLQWNRFIQVDSQFHMALVHIVGNLVFESVLRTVYDNIQPYDQTLPREEKLFKEYYRDLCEIVRAVEEKQPNRARLLAQDHIKRSTRFKVKKQ